MKVRFNDDSIRMRVRKSDLKELKSSGQTHTTIGLQPALTFMLKVEKVKHPTARLHGTTLTVALPEAAARHWMESEQVGISYSEQQPGGITVQLLVEKDFPCAHRPEEDKSDTFDELTEY